MSNAHCLKQESSDVRLDSGRDIFELILIATASAGILYFCFYQLAPWIWSQSMPYKADEIVPWQLPWLQERDGIEMYAMYLLMLLDFLFIYALNYVWRRFAVKPVRYFLALPLVALSFAFIFSIGFHPPMNAIAIYSVPDILSRSFTVMFVILPIIAALYYLQTHSARWTLIALAYLLIPICFISSKPISWFDYQYIFAPALRLLHGADVSEIYFQYDFLLSLIGLVWMKLQLDLNLFQMVAQFTYYLFLLVLFTFSRNFFLDKRISVFLLIALVLLRIYAGPYDAVSVFQVTPLRLDMWLILLLLVYFKGAYHWSAGVFCGLMLLLHKNFGIIYTGAYIQLLLTLCLFDAVAISDGIVKNVSMALRLFFKRSYLNLAFILLGALAHYLLFNSENGRSDFYYQQL
ncbi:MAG: hypothetical protein R8K20_04670 [Gallionellaceae bacterium]